MSSWESQFQEESERLQAQGLLRTLFAVDSEQDTTITISGKRLLSFCSNNYLGLANHPLLKQAAISAIEKFGVGAGASRLVSGNCSLYETLENEIATFKGVEKALVFNSGYTANVGILNALIGEDDWVYFDRLNHASLFDGVKMAGSRLRVYRHKDMDQLKKLLSERPSLHRAMIVTDGVFSMDGDIAALPDLVLLANQYDAIIYLDDAHATGVLGENGKGTRAHFDLQSDRIIEMGTFSKALGGFGGFVAGSERLISYLMNKAKSLIYTTALPPSVIATAIAAIQLIQKEPSRIMRLWDNTATLREAIIAMGYDTCGSETPIIPILIGEADVAMAFSKRLIACGIYVPAIRPPTVPKGKSRLRITLMATHTKEQIALLTSSLKEIGSDLGVL
ncbi:MAG: 8-amino-7-oxononanoate synthase [Nitrospirota bacterium]